MYYQEILSLRKEAAPDTPVEQSNEVVYTPAPLVPAQSTAPVVELKTAQVVPEEPPAQMDFEAALSMLKKNKAKKAAEKEAEENEPDEPEEEAFETITTSSGRKFRHVGIKRLLWGGLLESVCHRYWNYAATFFQRYIHYSKKF